jgi:hypothetical protein
MLAGAALRICLPGNMRITTFLSRLFDSPTGTFLPGKQLRQHEDSAKLATCR